MSNLYVVDGSVKPEEKEDRLDIEVEMLETIEKMDIYAWNKGKLGGLDWGNKSLNESFDGLQSGLILLAGQPNVGKSAMCIQLGWQIAQANTQTTEERPNKAYVLYFSLDDNSEDLLPRVIAIDQRIPINAVKAPKKYEDNLIYMTRRSAGIRKLKEYTPYFKIVDSRAGTNIEHIEQTIKEHQIALSMKDESYKVVVIIDNFHDITVNEMNFRGDGNAKYDYIAGELSRICTQYDIPVICTAEFRKLNGNRRPTPDDLRETVKIQYEAKAIILCYNEVGLRGEGANIFWQKPDNPYKQPVLELKIGKNKYSSFKNRIYMEFMPEMSYLKEASEESAKRYNQMILA
jgi:replicative DNA helicase